MTSSLRTVMLLAVALLSTGCLRSTTTVVVDESGGGEASVLLALDPVRTAEVAAQTGGIAATQLSDANSTQLCAQFRELVSPPEVPATATVSEYEADGLCGQQIDFTFTDGQDLAVILDQVTGGQAGDLDSFVLEQQGDEWVFDAPLTGFTSALQTTASSFPPAVVGSALDNTAVTYDLTLPGTAVADATNADEVTGGRFVWSVDAANPPERLQARTTVDGGGAAGGFLGRLIIGVGIAGLLALGAVIVSRRSGGRGAVPDEGPQVHAPTNGVVQAGGLDHSALLPPGAEAAPQAAATATAPPPADPMPQQVDPRLLATGEAGADPASFDIDPTPAAIPMEAAAPADAAIPVEAATPIDDLRPLDAGAPADVAIPMEATAPASAEDVTAVGSAAEATAASTEAAEAGPEPRWDAQRAAWVADHPTEGLLVHDEATGQWRRA